MKLNLIFIVMGALTILAYPIVFVYSKLHHYLKPKESAQLATVLVSVSAAPHR